MLNKSVALNLSVSSVGSVIKKFDTHNSWISSEVSAGYAVHTEFHKFDIDSFFNRVPWELLDRALEWWVHEIQKKFPRRTFLKLGKKSGMKELLSSYARSFGPYLRNTNKKDHDPNITTTNSTNIDRNSMLFPIEKVPAVVRFDLHWNFCRFGSDLFRPDGMGFVQGSPVAPGACNLVCCYLEHSSMKSLVSPVHTRLLRCRWVDDLFFGSSVSSGGYCKRNNDEVVDMASSAVTLAIAPFEDNFGMKVEDVSVFVGFSVGISSASSLLTLEPYVDATKVRLQHGTSAKPLRFLRGVLTGQLLVCYDRCLETSPVPSLVAFLQHCFELRYSRALLKGSAYAVFRRHPYFSDSLSEAFNQAGVAYDLGMPPLLAKNKETPKKKGMLKDSGVKFAPTRRKRT